MERFVLNVFKAIMISMIMIFTFDMLSYLYRAMTLNNKMENLMTSMQRVVMENNYLPEGAYDEYWTLFQNLKLSYNGNTNSPTTEHIRGSIRKEEFIQGFTMNYKKDLVSANKAAIVNSFASGEGILRTKMYSPANYGDVMAVQVAVAINQPLWRFTNYSHVDGGDLGMPNFNRAQYGTTWLSYTYYVPCLHYQRLED